MEKIDEFTIYGQLPRKSEVDQLIDSFSEKLK